MNWRRLLAIVCVFRGHDRATVYGERAHDRNPSRTEQVAVTGCARCDALLDETIVVSQHPRTRR